MFAPVDVSDLDVETTITALQGARIELLRAGAKRLALAAHWADLHTTPTPTPTPSGFHPGGERLRPAGADGTPLIQEFAAAELGVLLHTSTHTAQTLIRDAVDLRHRHPHLWHALGHGDVEDWQARTVARATRTADLTLEEAHWVDERAIDALLGMSFGRAMAVVEGLIVAANPTKAEARRLAAEQRRYVHATRTTGEGMRTLIAHTTAADVTRILAMVGHLADLLAVHGDTDPADTRRTKALALLANPAQACILLAHPTPDHADEHADAEVAPVIAHARDAGRALAALGDRALDRLAPKAVLYLHLSEEALSQHTLTGPTTPGGVVRAEGIGPLTLGQTRDWLVGARVRLAPVIDLTDQISVDAYEIPHRIAEHVRLATPYEVFPYGTRPSRIGDLDHTVPYVPTSEGGPPGQTRPGNLGPLSRHHHRVKTHGRWQHHQPLPGLHLWRTPHGHWYAVDHTGTHPLGTQTPEVITHTRTKRTPEAEVALRLIAGTHRAGMEIGEFGVSS